MSDDEETETVQARLQRLAGMAPTAKAPAREITAAAGAEAETEDSASTAITENQSSPQNVHISTEYMELEAEMSRDKQALLEEFERRRKARQINVSTDDGEVRRSLRQLGEPVCLFGEGPAERRARLRDLLSFLGEDAIHKRMEEEEARLQQERGQEGTWYHEGPPELRTARLWLARYSLPRAAARLRAARAEAAVGGAARAGARQEVQRRLGGAGVLASQVGDARPLTHCCFSDASDMIATSSWSGLVKVWSVPDCSLMLSLRGHGAQAGAVAWRPGAGKEHPKEVCLASCAYDGSVKLWNLAGEEEIASLEGHAPHRVSRVGWHPSGRLLGTCCRDGSWRLWDVEAGRELLHQEGHARPPHCIAFQQDGSLAATGGLDAFGRVWDLRTGRCIMFMEGHLKAVYGVDWAPSGYQLATAAGDNTGRIWDLRKRSCLYTLPAHTNLLSGVRYQRSSGHYLVTGSYDGCARLWAGHTWQPLKTLQGHDSKLMGLDISPDDKYIATCSYDRTFKLWGAET